MEKETRLQNYPESVVVENEMRRERKNCIAVVNTFVEKSSVCDLPEVVERGIVDWNKETAIVRGLHNVQGALNNAIFARIKIRNDGQNSIEFCQQYLNGQFSPLMSVKQSDLIVAWKIEKTKKEEANKAKLRRANKFFETLEAEYYGKLQVGICEMYDIRDIMEVLLSALPLLPIKKSYIAQLKREKLYNQIRESVRMFEVEEHKEYYAFENDLFEYIAESMGLTKIDLLEKLEREDLLYNSPSSSGYKINVRTYDKDGNECIRRRYCIKKIMLIDDDDEEEENLQF